jgi:endonuclease/exonuclease/phosphatase family metal-dependent hydrolase
MKRTFLILLVLIPGTLFAQPVNIISFNIRYNNPGDGINAWPNPIKMAAGLLRFHDADIFGLQEALPTFPIRPPACLRAGRNLKII